MHLSPKAFDLLTILIELVPTRVEERAASILVAVDIRFGEPTCRASSPRFERRWAIRRVSRASSGRYTDSAMRLRSGGHVRIGPGARVDELLLAGQGWPQAALQPGENLLGRDGDGIQIDSSTVSRRHARIVIAGEEVVLDDLGSKNGTFVCGSPVSTAVRLKDGDEIRTGSVVFCFRMTTPKGSTATWSGEKP